MTCPFCGDVLQAETYPDLEVDRCRSCAALWFDAGKLARYQRARHGCASEPICVTTLPGEAAPLRCPRCASETLVCCQIRYIRARHCSACDGLAIRAVPLAGARVRALHPLEGAVEVLEAVEMILE